MEKKKAPMVLFTMEPSPKQARNTVPPTAIMIPARRPFVRFQIILFMGIR